MNRNLLQADLTTTPTDLLLWNLDAFGGTFPGWGLGDLLDSIGSSNNEIAIQQSLSNVSPNRTSSDAYHVEGNMQNHAGTSLGSASSQRLC